MPLLNEHLSVWEIAHRWAGYQPQLLRPVLPLAVQDNCRVLMQEILHMRLECMTLDCRKWRPEDGEDAEPFFIRYHLDDVEECIAGNRYSRKLLTWALIERWAFADWCDRRSVPRPEFWFPSGWAEHIRPFGVDQEDEGSDDESKEARRVGQIIKLATQHLAQVKWKRDPTITITAMAADKAMLASTEADRYGKSTIRGWLSEVAPAEAKRPGRPKKAKKDED